MFRTEELSETCTVYFQNKFEKLVKLVGFIIRTVSKEFFISSIVSVSGPISNLDDHPLSAVRYDFFDIFVATLIFRSLPEEEPFHGDRIRLIAKYSCRVTK